MYDSFDENRDVCVGFGAEKRDPPSRTLLLLVLLFPYLMSLPLPKRVLGVVLFVDGVAFALRLDANRDVPFIALFAKRDAPSLLEKRDAPALFPKRDAPFSFRFWSRSRLNALSFPLPKPFGRLALFPNGRRSLLPRLKLFPPEFPRYRELRLLPCEFDFDSSNSLGFTT